MSTLDKAKFIHKSFFNPKNFTKEMLEKPQKERTINIPEQIVVLMSNLFTLTPKKLSALEAEAIKFKLSTKDRLKKIEELYVKKKSNMNPIIK